MTVTRTSPFTGKQSKMELPITDEQMLEWNGGRTRRKIQEIFPNLTADQREFILTGILPAEWDAAFKPTR